MNKTIAQIREDYTKFCIDELGLAANATHQFKKWFQEALDQKLPEANAMVLSTVSKEGVPSGRVLLLKDLDDIGFCFFTNYDSAKADDLRENPIACMTFFWAELERQVRITGSIVKLSHKESVAYFHSRPRQSQLSASASPQSQVVENRAFLEQIVFELDELYKGEEIPKPNNWGGYKLMPQKIEFWQGRASRLHDRFLYEKVGNSWTINRLAP